MSKTNTVVLVSLLLLCMGSCQAGGLQGIAVDKDGRPVKGASIAVGLCAGHKTSWHTVSTDADGAFGCTSPDLTDSADCSVVVTADGYGLATTSATTGKKQQVRLALYPEQKLSGAVTDEAGKPLAGVRVSLARCCAYGSRGCRVDFTADASDGAPAVVTTTGPDGRFALGGLPTPTYFEYGSLVVSASTEGRAPAQREIRMDRLGEQVSIVSPLPAALKSTLYLPERSAAAPEGIELTLIDAGGLEAKAGQTDKNGSFSFENLAPGPYKLMLGPNCWYRIGSDGEIQAPKLMEWALPVVNCDLKAGDNRLDPVMIAGALVSGKVINRQDGTPIKGAVVGAYHPGRTADRPPTCALTDGDGRFELRVAPGSVKLVVDGFKWNGIAVRFQPDERPTLAMNLADGERKDNVRLEVSPGDSHETAHAIQSRDKTVGLELLPGTYDLHWDPQVACFDAIPTFMPKQGDYVSDRIKKAPTFVSSRPRRPAYAFDGTDDAGLLLMIADESRGTGEGWDTGYIDLNRNDDLTDDTPVKWECPGERVQGVSGWATAQATQGPPGPEQTHNPIQVRLRASWRGDLFISELERRGAWRGSIASNKGNLDCIVADSNANGIWGDPESVDANLNPRSGDSVFLDTNSFGCAVLCTASPHRVILSQVSEAAGKFYKITTNGVGNRITVEPYTGSTGKIRVKSSGVNGMPARAERMELSGKIGLFRVSCDKDVELPVGRYRMEDCVVRLESRSGESVALYCTVDQTVDVEPDQVAEVDVCGQLGATVCPDDQLTTIKTGLTSTLDWEIGLGEGISVYRTSLGTRCIEGSVRLISPDGKNVTAIRASHACRDCGGACRLAIDVPLMEPGRYTMELALETRSPLGTLVASREVIVKDDLYGRLARAIEQASPSAAAAARTQLHKQWFTQTIAPGQPVDVREECRFSEAASVDPKMVSAAVRWYPEADRLRAVAEVTDAFFAPSSSDVQPWCASAVEFLVSPSGLDRDINQFILVPKGPAQSPTMLIRECVDGQPGPALQKEGIRANWTRTPKGYRAEIAIPWKAIKGYEPGWSKMPVQVVVDSKTRSGVAYVVLSRGGMPWSARTFAALTPPLPVPAAQAAQQRVNPPAEPPRP